MENLTLEKVDQMNAEEYSPAIVVMILIVIFGLTGNIFAATFYIRKAKESVLHIFISCLSINDAVTNIVLVQEIVHLFFYLSNEDIITCKLFLVLKHWLIGNSLLFMVAMAADRYRRICFPFSKQITYKVASFIILGITSFSFLIASRNIATIHIFKFNITTDSNSTITGYYCTQSKENEFAQVGTIFQVVDICIHGIIMCSFVTLNILLVRKIVYTKQKLKTHGLSDSLKINELHNESSVGGSTDIDRNTFDNNGDNIEPTAEGKEKERENAKVENNPTVKTGTLKSKNGTFRRTITLIYASRTEIKITVMIVVITVISALCFVPYYVAMLTVKQDFSGSIHIMTLVEILARRSYILNSAINPFIMVVFNLPFRLFVQSVVCFKCFRCSKHQ